MQLFILFVITNETHGCWPPIVRLLGQGFWTLGIVGMNWCPSSLEQWLPQLLPPPWSREAMDKLPSLIQGIMTWEVTPPASLSVLWPPPTPLVTFPCYTMKWIHKGSTCLEYISLQDSWQNVHLELTSLVRPIPSVWCMKPSYHCLHHGVDVWDFPSPFFKILLSSRIFSLSLIGRPALPISTSRPISRDPNGLELCLPY